MSLSKSGGGFSVAPGQAVLDAALAAGLNLPHSCKGGNCGACRARLLAGAVDYPEGRPLGLSDAEVADGYILLCRARAQSDLELENVAVSTAADSVVKRLPARIEHWVLLAHDVLALYLRLPAAEPFAFAPGQYIDVMLPRGRRRSFSIASPPHAAALLELHVRRVPGGEFTEPLFAAASAGAGLGRALLSIEGPFGDFVYRESPAPLLLIGGGTGLAPLKSIMRHVLETGLSRAITVYWGVRSERDLYAHAELEALASRAPDFRYYPVLSEPDAHWTGRRGLVHDAVLEDCAVGTGARSTPAPRLDRADIYASGPPAMIAAVRTGLVAGGADPQRLFFDSFDYAPDALARQRTSASTKS